MSIRLFSHLHQIRYGVYGFRFVIPQDLRLSLQKKEIRVSLRTTNRPAAKQLALRFTILTNNYLAKIRNAPTYEEMVETGKEFLQALGGTTFESITEKLLLLAPIAQGESKQVLHEIIELRRQVSSNEASKVEHFRATVDQLQGKDDNEVDSIICDLYAELTPLVVESHRLSSDFNKLILRAQEAHLADRHQLQLLALENSQQAEIGNITNLAAEIAAKATLMAASSNPETKGGMVTKPDSKCLTKIVEAYCANQIGEGSWTQKTEAENRAIYALWITVVGDRLC